MMKNKCVILLSGGLDSVVSAVLVKEQYDEVHALFFNYGQKAFLSEERAVKEISEIYGFKLNEINIEFLGKISNSAVNTEKELPKISENELEDSEYMQKCADSVWVPNRNGVFVNIAAAYAEANGISDIIIGANREEAGTFKDNSEKFIAAVNNSLENSTNSNVRLVAPLINYDKSGIVNQCLKHEIPLEKVYSCYETGEKHCGKCESCVRLKRALELNGRRDIIKKVFGD